MAESLEHRLRPLSAGFAVPSSPSFPPALPLGGIDGFRSALADPVALGIVAALVAGKTVGVFGTTFLVTKTTRAKLDDGLPGSTLPALRSWQAWASRCRC